MSVHLRFCDASRPRDCPHIFALTSKFANAVSECFQFLQTAGRFLFLNVLFERSNSRMTAECVHSYYRLSGDKSAPNGTNLALGSRELFARPF
jgi:hypothetical protein